jgi:hypothetical protein
MIGLEEEKNNFGGFVDMVRWSLGVVKVINDGEEGEKGAGILMKVVGLFS